MKLIFTRVGIAPGSWSKYPAGRGRSLFTSSQSTEVHTQAGSTIENDPKMTSLGMKNHPVMILCALSRLPMAIGTDSWY